MRSPHAFEAVLLHCALETLADAAASIDDASGW